MAKITSLQTMLITAILYAVSMSLFAESSDLEARFRACASVVDDGKRLSCYDQILISDEVSDQPGASAPTESSDVATSDMTSEAPHVAASDMTSEVPDAVVKDQTSVAPSFGLKQKLPREGLSITVTVKGIRKNLAGRFVYTTMDNQRWVQNDTRRVHYDEVPFVAEIRTATLGSFYLKPKLNGVSVKVRREK